MRIVVNDIVAVPNSGGVYSILTDFYNEVLNYSKLHKDVEWIFLVSGKFLKETDNIKIICFPEIKKSHLKRLLFELLNGKKIINSLKPDVYLSLQNTMTLGVNAKKWTYLHQPLPYQKEMKFSIFKRLERKMLFYKYIVGSVINYTLSHGDTKIIVQTSWMKDAVVEKNITTEENIVVFPPKAVSHLNFSVHEEKIFNNFFYPATGMVYKNHALLFKAAKMLEDEGFKFNIYCTLTPDELKNLGLKSINSIHVLGRVDRQEVLRRYSESTLVFPSLIETYGLPLQEAKNAGTFILAGDTSFSNEILESYPNKDLFDPYRFEDLADKMRLCLEGKVKIIQKSNEKSHSENTKGSLVNLITDGVISDE